MGGGWGLKRIKVTRCNRMALRVCVCMCVCVRQELLLWLSSLNPVNLYKVFSLCPDMLALSLFLALSLSPSLSHDAFSLSLCG